MKTIKFFIILTIVLISFTTTNAQKELIWSDNTNITTASNTGAKVSEKQIVTVGRGNKIEEKKGLTATEQVFLNNSSVAQEATSFQILAKKIPSDFTGYMIRVISCGSEGLPSTHKLFSEFGKVKMDRTADGQCHYMLCEFTKDTLAYEYLTKVVMTRYPSAGVVYYENGKLVSGN